MSSLLTVPTDDSGLLSWFRWFEEDLSSGLLLTFLTTHLFQFCFEETEQYWRPSGTVELSTEFGHHWFRVAWWCLQCQMRWSTRRPVSKSPKLQYTPPVAWESLASTANHPCTFRPDASESLGFQEDSDVAALLNNESTSNAYSYEFGVPCDGSRGPLQLDSSHRLSAGFFVTVSLGSFVIASSHGGEHRKTYGMDPSAPLHHAGPFVQGGPDEHDADPEHP